jgi:hypothetical protein
LDANKIDRSQKYRGKKQSDAYLDRLIVTESKHNAPHRSPAFPLLLINAQSAALQRVWKKEARRVTLGDKKRDDVVIMMACKCSMVVEISGKNAKQNKASLRDKEENKQTIKWWQSNCRAFVKRPQSYLKVILQPLRIDFAAIPRRLRSDSASNAERQRSDCAATAQRLRSDCAATA